VKRSTVEIQEGDDWWPVCCLNNNSLSDIKPQKWSVRILKLRNYMYLGICLLKSVESHNFRMWPWRDIGHGHYCVCSDGYAYSHSNSDINFEINSFTFEAGDILHFKYYPVQGKLNIQKGSQ
jgi:hypothetical protein